MFLSFLSVRNIENFFFMQKQINLNGINFSQLQFIYHTLSKMLLHIYPKEKREVHIKT